MHDDGDAALHPIRRHFTPSKGPVEALVPQTAAEEAVHGIRANAVAGGWVSARTIDEFRAMIPDDLSAEPSSREAMLFAILRQIMNNLPLKRPATLAEAASLFAFLAPDQAAYVTGQTIALHGGMMI